MKEGRILPDESSGRVKERRSADEISDRSAASAPNIHRDVVKLKKELRKKFSEKGFDARAEIGARATCYEAIIHDCMRDAARTNDLKERALLRKVAADTSEKLTDLLERCGLIDRRAFLIPVEDDGKKIDRIPSGEELQKFFESVHVPDGELRSAAEVAMLYGDAEAAERLSAEHERTHDDEREHRAVYGSAISGFFMANQRERSERW